MPEEKPCEHRHIDFDPDDEAAWTCRNCRREFIPVVRSGTFAELTAPQVGGSNNPGQPHIVGGEFQSDKYPSCPRGKVPLSTKDPIAQDLLWEYAQRRRAVDAEFADDLEFALKAKGYTPLQVPSDASACWCSDRMSGGLPCPPGQCPNRPPVPEEPAWLASLRWLTKIAPEKRGARGGPRVPWPTIDALFTLVDACPKLEIRHRLLAALEEDTAPESPDDPRTTADLVDCLHGQRDRHRDELAEAIKRVELAEQREKEARRTAEEWRNEANDNADACERNRVARAEERKKWWNYEQEYILPCFKWAEECGIDLHALVRDGGGNCVAKLVGALRSSLAERTAELQGQSDVLAVAMRKLEALIAVQPAGGEEEGMWKAMRILESLQKAPTPQTKEQPGERPIQTELTKAGVDADRVAERALCALYIYPNYRVDSRGPSGLLLDILRESRPDIADELRGEAEASVLYTRHFGEAFGKEDESWRQLKPVELVILCPKCGKQHLDSGEFATRVHRMHFCENTPEGEKTGCGFRWKPFEYPTKGVLGEKKEEPTTLGSTPAIEASQKGLRELEKLTGASATHIERFTLEELNELREACTTANVFVETHPDEFDDIELEAPDELLGMLERLSPRRVAMLVQAAERDLLAGGGSDG